MTVTRVERNLLQPKALQAIVLAFKQASNFEACLEAIVKMTTKSGPLSFALASSALFVDEVVTRLAYPKAIVRKNLLMAVKALSRAATSKARLALDYGLYGVVRQLSEDASQVLVAQLARQQLAEWDGDLEFAST